MAHIIPFAKLNDVRRDTSERQLYLLVDFACIVFCKPFFSHGEPAKMNM